MPNTKYANSARREMQIKHELEEDGWYAIRASGSHGLADVVAVKPVKSCTSPSHFEVKFIQVKTSQSIRELKIIPKAEDSPAGLINIEYRYFPVKNDKFWEAHKKRKEKAKIKQ